MLQRFDATAIVKCQGGRDTSLGSIFREAFSGANFSVHLRGSGLGGG